MERTRFRRPHAMYRFLGLPVALLLVGLFAATPIVAEQAYHPTFGYWIDAPANWESLPTGDSSVVAFTDPSEQIVLQIMSFEPERFESAEAIADHIRSRLDAQGETATFEYLGRQAVLADFLFDGPVGSTRGYFTFYDTPFADHAAFAYVAEDLYVDAHDFLLSSLDSFSPSARGRRRPGPISTFLAGDVLDEWETRTIPGPFDDMTVRLDVGGVPNAEELIHREARILSLFQSGGGLVDGWDDAWRRFYRMVYRDNYGRLEPLAQEIRSRLEEEEVLHEEIPAVLLKWLQGFDYHRTGSLSDLATPTTCLLEFSGDCDGLGLLYATLLHQLGFDAVLMVSMVHSHALVGVDVAGEGARFPYKATNYLVAEVTDDVEIGLIAASMADPADWLGVQLR